MVGFLMHKREVIILSIKVTRKLLKEYVKIKREIPLLRVELHEMNTTDSGLGNSVIQDCRRGYPSPRTVIGFDHERYNNKRDILEHKELQCAAVEQWIGAIEDTQTRAVFKMRYIENLKWEKIAKKMHLSSADYARIVVHDRYLEKIFEKK